VKCTRLVQGVGPRAEPTGSRLAANGRPGQAETL